MNKIPDYRLTLTDKLYLMCSVFKTNDIRIKHISNKLRKYYDKKIPNYKFVDYERFLREKAYYLINNYDAGNI